jgi:electron transfer flavoprotein beta subunit
MIDNMNILVCVKQVPDTTEIKIDPVTNTLIRAGVPSIVNTYDGFALEMAVRLAEVSGGQVVVVSMGPEQAKEALRTCLSRGAQKAYLVSDGKFGGSDTLATSYILSGAVCEIEKIEGAFDLIFCGKQAIDGDTAQVGPELAEWLDFPQVTYALDVILSDGKVQVKRESDEGYDVVETDCPAVITVTKPAFEPRIASIRDRMNAKKADIAKLTFNEIKIDPSKIGLKGSPTKVKRTFTPSTQRRCIRIEEHTAAAGAAKLVRLLSDAAVL